MSPSRPHEPEAPAGAPRLKATSPASLVHAGRRYQLLGSGLTIGREVDNDVVLDADRASRHHARVRPQHDGTWAVEDLGALNGTFVNGERLRGRARGLANGDTVSIGGERLTFVT